MDNEDDAFEARLRIAEPPIADDGFSGVVLARLPAKRLRAKTARCLSLAVAGSIGSLVTLISVSPDFFPRELLTALIAGSGATVATVLTSAAVAGLLMVPLAWLVYAEMADRDGE